MRMNFQQITGIELRLFKNAVPLIFNITNSMERSSSREAVSHSDSQEIPRLLLNLRFH
jgi:hypothetical protein